MCPHHTGARSSTDSLDHGLNPPQQFGPQESSKRRRVRTSLWWVPGCMSQGHRCHPRLLRDDSSTVSARQGLLRDPFVETRGIQVR